VNLNSTNMRMSDVYLNINNTGISFDPNTNSIKFFLSSAQAEFTFDYTINSDPQVIYDYGLGLFAVQKLDIAFSSVLGMNSLHELTVSITQVSIDIQPADVIIYFHGQGDISKAINFILNSIKQIFIGKINEMLMPAVQRIMQTLVNKGLSEFNYYQNIKNTPLYIDYSLTQPPQVKSNYVAFFFNGSFFLQQETILTNSSNVMPEFDTTGKDMQFYISAYTLESALDAMYQGNMLKATINPVEKVGNKTVFINTTTLGIFVPNYVNKYGRDKPVTTDIHSEYPPPVVTITVGENICNMNFRIDQYVTEDNMIPVRAITMHVSAEFAARITTVGKNIIPTLDIINITIISYESDMGNIDTASINMLLNFMEALILPILNNKISQGFELPIIHQVIDLTNSTVKTDNGFIEIETTPVFKVYQLPESVQPVKYQATRRTKEEILKKFDSKSDKLTQAVMNRVMKNFKGFVMQQE